MRGQGALTKRAILAAALDAFSKGDFHKVTIRSIAKRASVATGTIYTYFPDKESLLFSILESKANEVASDIEKSIEGIEHSYEKIRKALSSTLRFVEKNARFGMVLFIVVPLRSWMADRSFRESRWSEMFIRIFQEGQARGELRSDIDPIIMMDMVYALTQRQFQMRVFRRKARNLNPDQLADIIWSAFAKGNESRPTLKSD